MGNVISNAPADAPKRVANDTGYGLSSAAFARAITRATAVARRIESGIRHINSPTVRDEARMPFRGIAAIATQPDQFPI